MIQKKTCLLGALLFLCSVVSNAGDFDDYPALKQFVSNPILQQQYTPAELNAIFLKVERQKVTLDLMNRSAEKVALWKDYRARFLTPKNINQGVDFWHTYHEALAVAEQQLGVPPEIIIAILGVETRYGANKGRLKVIDSLASLAFDFPRRADFFTQELQAFLLLSKAQNMAPLQIRGSYAGAMGYPQFMPSSWQRLGIDFDGDNKADLINNPIDAIGSVANYFKENGWKSAPNVAIQATKTTENISLDTLSQALNTVSTVGALKAQGLSILGDVPDDTPASAIALEGDNGTEYWLCFNNFYAITRYNRSFMYAMAVFQLSQAIKTAKNQTPPPDSLMSLWNN